MEQEVTFATATGLWGEAYGSATLNSTVGASDWIVFNVTELVQGWQDGQWPNYGIGIDVAEAEAGDQYLNLDAHEKPFWGPQLHLIFKIPTPTPTFQSLYLPLLTR